MIDVSFPVEQTPNCRSFISRYKAAGATKEEKSFYEDCIQQAKPRTLEKDLEDVDTIYLAAVAGVIVVICLALIALGEIKHRKAKWGTWRK